MPKRKPPPVAEDAVVDDDVDLKHDDIHLPEGSRTTEQRADQLIDEVRSRGDRPSLLEMGRLKTDASSRESPVEDIVLNALAEQIRMWPRTQDRIFSGVLDRSRTKAVAGHLFPGAYPVSVRALGA